MLINREHTKAHAQGKIELSYTLSSEVTSSDPTTISFNISNLGSNKVDEIDFFVASNYELDDISTNIYSSNALMDYINVILEYDSTNTINYFYHFRYNNCG